MQFSRRTLLGAAIAAGFSSPALAFFNYRFRWAEFCEANLDASGRVIDASDERMITTSEGQSYALFFALVAGDRKAYARILSWTERNLCAGDITARLPAWLWGRLPRDRKHPEERWGVLDGNNATDADMWIAYSLMEAARLWGVPEYAQKASAILAMLSRLVRRIERLGPVLLPGASGFENAAGMRTVNPSYMPTFLLRRFADADPFWAPVAAACNRLLVRCSANGYAPDWATFNADGLHMLGEKDVGSFDAIRVYLWLGMLSRQDSSRDQLVRQFYPMVRRTQTQGYVPLKVNMATLAATGEGPIGFSACMLQLLTDVKWADLIRMKMRSTLMRPQTYYQNCLIMFAQGFDDGAFSFGVNGELRLRR